MVVRNPEGRSTSAFGYLLETYLSNKVCMRAEFARTFLSRQAWQTKRDTIRGLQFGVIKGEIKQ